MTGPSSAVCLSFEAVAENSPLTHRGKKPSSPTSSMSLSAPELYVNSSLVQCCRKLRLWMRIVHAYVLLQLRRSHLLQTVLPPASASEYTIMQKALLLSIYSLWIGLSAFHMGELIRSIWKRRQRRLYLPMAKEPLPIFAEMTTNVGPATHGDASPFMSPGMVRSATMQSPRDTSHSPLNRRRHSDIIFTGPPSRNQ